MGWELFDLSAEKSVRPKVLGVPHNSKAACGINSAKQAGKNGEGVGGIPPAEPVNKIGSNIFKRTPPVGSCPNRICACV